MRRRGNKQLKEEEIKFLRKILEGNRREIEKRIQEKNETHIRENIS